MGAALGSLLILLLASGYGGYVPNIPRAWGKAMMCELVDVGMATHYGIGDGFAGRKTANGEIYEIDKLTAAHLHLPLGSIVRVRSGAQEVVVRINDRGPAKWTGDSIDLTPKAFARLGPLERGVLPVTIELCTKT